MKRVRRRMGGRWLPLAALAAILVVMMGCGGSGGGGGSGDPQETAYTYPGGGGYLYRYGWSTYKAEFTVYWAARSNHELTSQATAPSSAVSFELTLEEAAEDGSDYTFSADRDPDPAAYVQTYVLPGQVRTGLTWVLVEFYSQLGATGDVVATAVAPVTISSDGTGLEDVTTTGTVASVEVPIGQQVPVSDVAADWVRLRCTVRSGNGQVLAVTPGSVFWSVVGGGEFLTFEDGVLAHGKADGTARVVATVDDHASSPQEVTVGDPQQAGPPPATLMLDKISVGLVPKATETVKVTARDAAGNTVTDFNVSVQSLDGSDPCVDATQVPGTKVLITAANTLPTGKRLWRGRVKVETTDGALSQDVEVCVYDPKVVPVWGAYVDDPASEEPALQIQFVDDFDWVWNNRGTGCNECVAFYNPVCPTGFYRLGSLALPFPGGWPSSTGSYADHRRAMLVVSGDMSAPNSPLKKPLRYTRLWATDGYTQVGAAGVGAWGDAAFWRPEPPAGYKAMGVLVTGNDEDDTPEDWIVPDPDDADVVCVREDLTAPGSVPYVNPLTGEVETRRVWVNKGYNCPDALGLWEIKPPPYGGPASGYVATGTFCGYAADEDREGGWKWSDAIWTTGPEAWQTPEMNVLDIRFPPLAEMAGQAYMPRLTGHFDPSEGQEDAMTKPVAARASLVPFTAIKDPRYGPDLEWTVANSPFYRLERVVFYKWVFSMTNPTSVEQSMTHSFTSGFTEGESSEMSHEWGVNVNYTQGFNAFGAEASVSIDLSYNLGISSSEYSENFEETTWEESLVVPPGTTAALAQQKHKFRVYRHNTNSAGEPIVQMFHETSELGLRHYTVAQYPPPESIALAAQIGGRAAGPFDVFSGPTW